MMRMHALMNKAVKPVARNHIPQRYCIEVYQHLPVTGT